jgi:maltose alpha-D-glucosyltransferase/alpha-amylase
VEGSAFHPRTTDEMHVLLAAFLLEKALYEVAYEVDNRPEWLPIPTAGIVELLADDPADGAR